MKKKIVASLLAFSIMTAISSPAFAAQQAIAPTTNSGIHILWNNTDTVSVMLNFSGNRASCASIIHAKSGTTKISATVLLKQVTSNGTKTVKSWSQSASSDTLYFDKEYYVTSGYTYELEVNANVYRNGIVENVSVTDRDSC